MAYKYKTGDQVRFLNDTGGGKITRIDEKGMVLVQTGDGFEIPVTAGELIPDMSFFEDTPEREVKETNLKIPVRDNKVQKNNANKPGDRDINFETEIPVNIPFDTDINVLLGFAADPGVPVFSSDISCYLINDSGFTLYYLAGVVRQGNYYFLASGAVEPDTKFLLGVFTHTEISKISAFHIQALFIAGGVYKRRQPLDILTDITKVNFSRESNFKENEYFEQKAVIFGGKELRKQEILLMKDDIKKHDKEAEAKKSPQDSLQVDLHIENLVENPGRLSPSEIIDIQLKKFHSSMNEALEMKAKRFIIVHGVGQGTLKMQIRRELQEKYPQYSFQDASFREYGFGATLVHLNIIKKQ